MNSKMKLVLLMVVVSMLVVGCGNDTDDAPDVGEETLDEVIEETVDAVETTVSTLCSACTVVNGEGSDSCTGVCD